MLYRRLLSRIYYTVVYFVLIREKNEMESSLQNKCESPLSYTPSPWRPRKKDLSYCECCHQHFTNLDEVNMFKKWLGFCCFHCLHLRYSLWYGLFFFLFLSLQHLQSDQHRTFVLDASNYSLVDQLVVDMDPEFSLSQPEQSEEILNKWVLNINIILLIFSGSEWSFCV